MARVASVPTERNGALVVLVLLLSVFAVQRPVDAQKIYLLVTGDTKDKKIGHADAIDMANVSVTFHAQVPKDQLEHYGFDSNRSSWTGPSIEEADDTKSAILGAIDRCPAGPNDTIVFYWSGHGMYDSGGHYLVMPSGAPLYRSEIITAIKNKSPRLAVVISDSCNVSPESRRLGPPQPCAVPPFAVTISPLFDQLFVRHQGLVNINAASEGETAACFRFPGGLFTAALTFYEERVDHEGRPTGRNAEIEVQPSSGTSYTAEVPFGFFWTCARERRTWSDLVTHVDQTMRTRWQRVTRQTVRVWSLPSVRPIGDHPNGIPTVLSLTRGDVVLSINGTSVANEKECRREIDNSGSTMEFTVRDSRDGTIWRMKTALRPTAPRFGVYLDDGKGGGALVTDVVFASPATLNFVLERISIGVGHGNPRIPAVLSLTPNDVILSINGRPIKDKADCDAAIDKARATMEFTVRDSRDGTVWRMQTNLRPKGPRFGVYLDDADGGGALITRVVPNSPAPRNRVLERVVGNTR